MSNLTFLEDIRKAEERLSDQPLEVLLGKGLMMPFNATNSGSRKILHSTQLEHVIPLVNPEIPLLQAGYENEFGKFSSSFVKADADYDVLARIEKFTHYPGHHYFLLVHNRDTDEYDVIERVSYEHLTESYGYLYNNTNIDKYKVGSVIPKNETIKKSNAFDEFNNRQDGVNLITTYMSCEYTKEDGIIISKRAKKKLSSPLVKKIKYIINDNDTPLNIYGNESMYKVIPDIGEEIKNGTVLALRREKKEESLFSLSYDRLRTMMMSDERFLAIGTVVDIDIYSNNPENMNDNIYRTQLKYYHDEKYKFMTNLISAYNKIPEDAKKSYRLQKMVYNAKKILNGGQYINDKLYNDTVIELTVLEISEVSIGDKITNRYGGKGVVSMILDDEKMPQMENGEHVDIIYNSSTCVNRENAGQLFETSINHIGCKICDFVNTRTTDLDEALEMYFTFLYHLSPELSSYAQNLLSHANVDDQIAYMEAIFREDGLQVSINPITDPMNIDKLNMLYKEFPFAQSQYNIKIGQRDSMGNIRYINTRRPLVCGYQYIYRLKQYAEDKFSAVSLAATNIKNENSRTSSKKSYRSSYAKTPIRFGEMETGDFGHLGMETTIVNLMLHSASPNGRRLTEQLLTGDPFKIDIKLDDKSKNRSVEINDVYLFTMGLKLEFIKRRKVLKKPLGKAPIYYKVLPMDNYKRKPIVQAKENQYVDPYEYCMGFKKDIYKYPLLKSPIALEKCSKEFGNNDKQQ